jgi:dihydrodipicolinate synthase/N-acetylneuraminate lyase
LLSNQLEEYTGAMKKTAVTFEDLSRSVLAVPPLARRLDLTINPDANRKLIRHLEGGGITTLLYGGNANFYHIAMSEYAGVLEFLATSCGEKTWVIPSVGPTFGMLLDQARVLRDFDFPTAMVLPASAPSSHSGIETGIRKFVEAFGKPAILYIKGDGYLTVQEVQRLVNDDLICAIKYAIVREDPKNDLFLRALTGAIDSRRLISGIGEQPAVVHLRDFGLCGFTSGCVCVAPRLSMQMLEALRARNYPAAENIRATFRPLEELRNQHGPIPVLHEAVTLCGIGDMGPILPLASNIPDSLRQQVREAATALLQHETAAASTARA